MILNTGGAVNGLIVSSGNVGIGTANPNRTLSVIGGFASGEGTASDVDGRVSLTWDSVANDASLSAYQGGYVKLRMDASPILLMTGNVGIGAADPSQKLDVNGQLRIRGGSPEANKVLTASDVNGNAAWALTTLSSSYVGTCGVVAEDFPYNNPTCKCNAGERIMLPSSFAGQVCSVENQNSASVQGRAQSFSSCTFSCFR
ncbi:MAG: hypothetical protein HYY86_00355 [Candidatus Harrisonbacteria bacterium]|nr:hypothetical protein [Candidatus Harrisonbacteria bacterium]